MEKFEVVQVFDNYLQAHILKSKLEAEGITCLLQDEQTVTMYWFWSNALGGIKLKVPADEAARARLLMAKIEAEAVAASEQPGFFEEDDDIQLAPDNRICIHCGSKNTKKQDYKKVPAFLSILLLGFPLMFRSDKWYCFHCYEEF